MSIGLVPAPGLSPDRLQTRRVPTGSVAGGGNVAVTVTWLLVFASANYTLSVSVVEATAGTSTLRVHHVESQGVTGAVVRVVNDDTLNAKTGTVHAIAILD